MLPTLKTRYPVLCSRLTVATAVSVATLLAGACASATPYPEQAAWRLGQAQAQQTALEAEDADWMAREKYVYRGGRDPKTGRADIQM